MLEWIAEDRPLGAVARKLKLSQSRVVQLKEKLVTMIREHFGDDIWRVLADMPQWKINITAMRECSACRFERSTASWV